MSWTLLLKSLGLVLGFMTVLWVISVFKRDASIVDPWWPILFLMIAAHCAFSTGWSPGKLLLMGMVGLWSIRLWFHLLSRSWGEPEDARYAGFRKHYGAHRYWRISFLQVFVLQGLLAVLISAPLQLAASAPPSDPVTWLDVLGAIVFAAGFAFESVGDWQLRKFRNDPANHGKVLDEGLWRYTRHPNYFGDALLWWGFWFCALDRPWGWTTAFAPALMTFLLLKVSGVPMMERLLSRTKPGYESYVRATSAFVPRPPKA